MTPHGLSDFERLTRVLERHLSPIHARSVLRHALSEHKLSATQFTLADLAKINGSLQRGLRLFTSELAASRAFKDIAAISGTSGAKVEPCAVDIDAEVDITRARGAARHMAEQLGAKAFTLQKITTIVSELARNIVSYTSGGKVELAWKDGPKRCVVIRATDRGPGISNLAHVLSGEYQSKTGLGRGLLGSKRLADRFDISTGRNGTQIIAEVEL